MIIVVLGVHDDNPMCCIYNRSCLWITTSLSKAYSSSLNVGLLNDLWKHSEISTSILLSQITIWKLTRNNRKSYLFSFNAEAEDILHFSVNISDVQIPTNTECIQLTSIMCLSKVWYIFFLWAIELYSCPLKTHQLYSPQHQMWINPLQKIVPTNVLFPPVWVTMDKHYSEQLLFFMKLNEMGLELGVTDWEGKSESIERHVGGLGLVESEKQTYRITPDLSSKCACECVPGFSWSFYVLK